MDEEDPLKDFLKSTGWSPNDLLEKLKKYTSVGTSTVKNENKECQSSDPKSSQNHGIKKAEGEVEKCVILSTQTLNETKSDDEEKKKEIDGGPLLEVVEVNICNSSQIETKLTNEVDCDQITSTDSEVDVDKNSQTAVGSCLIKLESGNDVFNEDDFSNTDEDEMAIKASNTSIINELIEDIFNNDDNLETSSKEKISPLSENICKVRGLQEIETNEDDEDDDFEDECVSALSKNENVMNSDISSSLNKKQTNTNQNTSTGHTSIIILSSSSSENSLGLEENSNKTIDADNLKSKNSENSHERSSILTSHNITIKDLATNSLTAVSLRLSKAIEENVKKKQLAINERLKNLDPIVKAADVKEKIRSLVNTENGDIIQQLAATVKDMDENDGDRKTDEDKQLETREKEPSKNDRKQAMQEVNMESGSLSVQIEYEVNTQPNKKETTNTKLPEDILQLNPEKLSQNKDKGDKGSSVPNNDTNHQTEEILLNVSSSTATNEQLLIAVTDKDLEKLTEQTDEYLFARQEPPDNKEKYGDINDMAERNQADYSLVLNDKSEAERSSEKKTDIFDFKMFKSCAQENKVEDGDEGNIKIVKYSTKPKINEDTDEMDSIDVSTLQTPEEQNKESRKIKEILNKSIFMENEEFKNNEGSKDQIRIITDKLISYDKFNSLKKLTDTENESLEKENEYDVPICVQKPQTNNETNVELSNGIKENTKTTRMYENYGINNELKENSLNDSGSNVETSGDKERDVEKFFIDETLKKPKQELDNSVQTSEMKNKIENTEIVNICDQPFENKLEENECVRIDYKDDNILRPETYNSEIDKNQTQETASVIQTSKMAKENYSEIVSIYESKLDENKLEKTENIKNIIANDENKCYTKDRENTKIHISKIQESQVDTTHNTIDILDDEEAGNVDIISASKTTQNIKNTFAKFGFNDTVAITEDTDNLEPVENSKHEPDNTGKISYMTKEQKTVENIRDILKMQLNCLRTRKKSNFLSNLRTSLNNFNATKQEGSSKEVSIDNKGTEDETNLDTQKIIDTQQEVEENNSKANKIIDDPHDSNDCKNSVLGVDDLYTQTNELGLVILNVQGGIELDNEEKTEVSSAHENNINTIDSSYDTSVSESVCFQNEEKPDETSEGTVFAEIRKIIRKPKSGKNFSRGILRPKRDISDFDIFNTDFSEPNKDAAIVDITNSFTSSADNSQSSFNLDNSEENTEKNSPFVSNTLDEFLTENSKLNISYNVPKCDAEEGLKETLLDKNLLEESPLILKKIVELKYDPDGKIRKNSKIKAKTLAQKRKLLERQKKIERKKLEKLIESAKIKQEQDGRNYILYKDKKIFVNGVPNIKSKCFARIDSSITNKKVPDMSTNTPKKKISLLAGDQKLREEIKYLPGPLSRKCTLQKTGNSFWETVTKKLPQIFLDVTPRIGHSLPKDVVARLPQFKTKISSFHIEFALSVLYDKSKITPLKTFRFPINYHNNQEQILVRKQRSIAAETSADSTDFVCGANTVEAVINDLIKYVEIKELEPSLIKEDDIHVLSSDALNSELHTSKININTVIKKSQKRKSKIDNELLRLNCKVVNVEVEEEKEEKPCNKPYCKLGCVCKSLRCENIISYHCQKPKCMFDCTCPKERPITYDHTVTFPAGTNVLSTDAVTRIEGEAKRNLAKVEREFTQTIIHTSDKTIVVGLGTRSKNRRATKIPIKYTDYFENIEEEGHSKINIPKKEFYRKCSVNLPKLNLNEIIPYCLVHHLYDCHCEGTAIYLKENEGSRKYNCSIKNENPPDRKKQKRDRSQDNSEVFSSSKKIKVEEAVEQGLESCASNINDTVNRSARPGRTIKKPSKFGDSYTYTIQKKSTEVYEHDDVDDSSLSCARINKVHSQYFRKNPVDPRIVLNDFMYNITESDVLQTKLCTQRNQRVLEADILKQCLIKSSGYLEENAKRKRKQIIEVRSDDVSSLPARAPSYPRLEGAIQRRKRSIAGKGKTKNIQSVFEGEIILDESNMELLKKMGSKTVADGYARLIPWKWLTKGFKDRTLSIWCMIDQPSRLLMNKTLPHVIPPPNYIDVRKATQTTQVILWILQDKLPSHYDEDNVSFIVKENRGHFEICGVCTKNLKGRKQTPDVDPSQLVTNKDSSEQNFLHKDLNGAAQILVLIKNTYKLQELIEEGVGDLDETSVEKTRLYMWAALPEVHKLSKWRMIYLNSDFTYLSFSKMKYTIKYTDLLSVNSLAKSSNSTILLKNAEMQNEYEHKDFGMYFDPHYQDRLFIGPYFIHKHIDNDIETLRYINQTLVCTESFNKMRGQGDYKCGYWLVERPYHPVKNRKESPKATNYLSNISTLMQPIGTIDLTKEEEKVQCGETKRENEPDVLIHNGERIKVIDAPPKKPEDFNRYIITNIPHFGYLGAFQYPKEIDVQWPFENKLLRFSSAKGAVDFLQTRFSSLLVPVPSSFKITVIILTQIDLANSKPIDASVLSGHYICGEFGFYNILSLTEEICVEKIGIPKEEVLRLFLTRARSVVKERLEYLASLLKIKKPTQGDLDFVSILDSAVEEITKQTELVKKQSVVRNKLLTEKRSKARRICHLISQLPPDQKVQENMKFRNIVCRTEPIEIHDSDDEEKNKQVNKKNKMRTMTRVDIPSTSFSPTNRPMQSILKPLIRVPLNNDRSVLLRSRPPAGYIKGVQVVKSVTGKYVLVPAKTGAVPYKFPQKSTKVVIQNNKIQSVSSDEKSATITRLPPSNAAQSNSLPTTAVSVLKDVSIANNPSAVDENIIEINDEDLDNNEESHNQSKDMGSESDTQFDEC